MHNNGKFGDQELVSQFINGNHNALEELIKRHQNKVFTYILLTIKDRHLAEDIFQDTFIKVINTLKSGSYNEEGKFLSWVMRIAHNLIIDSFRRSRRMPCVEATTEKDLFETIKVYEENVEDRIILSQIHNDVRRLIDVLPDEQREVLRLRHYDNLSFKEIAEQTHVSINTALGRMRYALINIRKIVKEKDIVLTR